MSPTLTDVRCVAVPVRDQDAALSFYVDRLGFELRLDAPITETQRWVEVRSTGRGHVAGPGCRSDNPAPGVDTGVRFAVGDAEAEHRTMADHGVSVGELLAWPDVPPMFTFDDPDGNRFYVVASD
jgi:predicted enzyme related to lactoylglutathione lyase